MDIKRGAFQPLPQVTYSHPRYHLCTNLTLSALLASYISPTTHDSSYIGTIHQTNLVPGGRDPYVQRRGSLVTEALGTRLQWNQSQDCFSTHVTINYQFFSRMASGYQLHIFPFLIPFSMFSRAYDHLHKAFSLTWHRLTGWLVTCFPARFTIAWLVTCQCFPALFTIAWMATCFPALFTIAWSLTSYALFAILYSVASFPALFIIAWLVTCFPAHFTMVYPITRFPAIFTIG